MFKQPDRPFIPIKEVWLHSSEERDDFNVKSFIIITVVVEVGSTFDPAFSPSNPCKTFRHAKELSFKEK